MQGLELVTHNQTYSYTYSHLHQTYSYTYSHLHLQFTFILHVLKKVKQKKKIKIELYESL